MKRRPQFRKNSIVAGTPVVRRTKRTLAGIAVFAVIGGVNVVGSAVAKADPTGPVASFSVTGMDGTDDTVVHFDASASSDSSGTITDFLWQWSDGSPNCDSQATPADADCSTAPSAQHDYPDPQSSSSSSGNPNLTPSVTSYEVTLWVKDSNGLTSAGFSKFVSPGQPIIANDDTASTYVETATNPVNVLANDNNGQDINGHPLTVSLDGYYPPLHGQAVVNDDDSITYTPATDWTGGTDYVVYDVNDGVGYSTDARITIQVGKFAAPKIIEKSCPQPGMPHKANAVCDVTVKDPNGPTAHNDYRVKGANLSPEGKDTRSFDLSLQGGQSETVRLVAASGKYNVTVSDPESGDVLTSARVTFPAAKVRHFTVRIKYVRGSQATVAVNNTNSSLKTKLKFVVAHHQHYRTARPRFKGFFFIPFPRGHHTLKVYFGHKLVTKRALRR